MTTTVLSVRLSEQERALLDAAAEQGHTTISDFVRRKAVEAAEIDVMERRIVTIPAEKWEEFEAWARRPAEVLPGLQRLARIVPPWQK